LDLLFVLYFVIIGMEEELVFMKVNIFKNLNLKINFYFLRKIGICERCKFYYCHH